jgi:hypothetical protein
VVTTTPCGSATRFDGGPSYPNEQIYTLGSGTGTVVFEFNPQSVPDRLIVEFDGAIVIDTKYTGSPNLQQLHGALQGFDPSTGTFYTEPNNGSFTGQAYAPNGPAPMPTVPNGGFVANRLNPANGFISTTAGVFQQYSFQKTTATTFCTIKVYAPISGTLWNLRANCPT